MAETKTTTRKSTGAKAATWTQNDRFECVYCNKTYVRMEALLKHEHNHQTPAPPKKESKKAAEGLFFCKVPHCALQTGYVHKRSLKAHMDRIHNHEYVKPACERCQKTFQTKSTLKRHQRDDNSCGGRYLK